MGALKAQLFFSILLPTWIQEPTPLFKCEQNTKPHCHFYYTFCVQKKRPTGDTMEEEKEEE
jgi:hypothetical protein